LIPSLLNVIVVPPLLALVIAAVVIAVLMRSRVAALLLDRPNQRSLHAAPIPRLGGIGIIAGVTAAWIYAAPEIDLGLAVALVLLIGVSLRDDLGSVGVLWRLLAHFASALLPMTALLYASHGIWLTLAAALATAWMINLYNFMDGSDGLAGGMAVFGFGSYGYAALTGGDFSFAAINFSVAAAALGFLFFNFPPARIFMGDVGAIPLGYLAAVLGIAGWLRGDWPLWFGVIVFSPFIVDATCTLLKRLVRGAKVWHAHREHYYQRLVQSGWGHRKTALAEYGLMTLTSGIALAGMRLDPAHQIDALLAVAFLYAVLIVALERSLGRHAGQRV
jgi:UDP-N-acetylmuramyl pentapeptide phosphotransferase/UDP-N-acetylglucosamine-1-phosphate transferase